MAKLNISILILFFLLFFVKKNNSIYMVLLILKLTLIASLMFLFSYTAFLSCSFTINLCCDSSQFFYGVCYFISRSLITFKYFNLPVQVIIFFLQFSAEEVSRFSQIECLNVSSKHAWEKESITVTFLAAKYLNSTCC